VFELFLNLNTWHSWCAPRTRISISDPASFESFHQSVNFPLAHNQLSFFHHISLVVRVPESRYRIADDHWSSCGAFSTKNRQCVAVLRIQLKRNRYKWRKAHICLTIIFSMLSTSVSTLYSFTFPRTCFHDRPYYLEQRGCFSNARTVQSV
jgi:hypothetical protein